MTTEHCKFLLSALQKDEFFDFRSLTLSDSEGKVEDLIKALIETTKCERNEILSFLINSPNININAVDRDGHTLLLECLKPVLTVCMPGLSREDRDDYYQRAFRNAANKIANCVRLLLRHPGIHAIT